MQLLPPKVRVSRRLHSFSGIMKLHVRLRSINGGRTEEEAFFARRKLSSGIAGFNAACSLAPKAARMLRFVRKDVIPHPPSVVRRWMLHLTDAWLTFKLVFPRSRLAASTSS